MELRKIQILGVAVATLTFSFGCSEYLDKQAQNSAQATILEGDTTDYKEKQKMLNEIYSSANFIPPGEVRDVRHIVEKYLPIGTSREQVKKTLREMNNQYSEYVDTIEAGSKGDKPLFVPNPVVRIQLHFDNADCLDGIKANYMYQQ